MASATTDRRMGLTNDKGVKAPVRVGSTGNLTLSALQTVDGVALASGDRVLAKNQTNAVENGIWVASTAAWTRDIDADGTQDLVKGTVVLITDGSQAGQFWQITSSNPILPGTSSIAWAVSLTAGIDTLSFIQAGAGAQARPAQTKAREDFNASDFATGGTGTSGNPYTGWETAFAALPNGETLDLEAAWYTSAGGWTRNLSTSIRGKGAGSVLQFTGIAGSSVNVGIGGMTFNGTPRAGYPGTVYNMGTGALTAGQTVFAFSSVAGLAIGDEVFLALGVDPYDGGQSFFRMFNRVENIAGLNVTFAVPLPEAVGVVGAPAFGFSPTFHECVKFTNIVQNVSLRNFAMTQTAGPAYDRCLFISRCRNVFLDELYFDDVLGGPYIAECENVKIGAIYGRRIRGSYFGAYGTTNLRAELLYCSDLVGVGVFFENQMRNARVGALNLQGGSGKTASSFFQVTGGSLGVHVEDLKLSNKALATAQALVVLNASQVNIENTRLGANINAYPLKYNCGQISFGGNNYRDLKRFEIKVTITKNMAAVAFTLPSGLLRSLKGYISNKTGITFVKLVNTSYNRSLIDTGNVVDYFPAAGTFGEMSIDDFVTVGSDTASYAFNGDPTGKQLQITTDGTATEGAILILEGECYVPVGSSDGVNGRQDLGNLASLSGAKTLNFAAPGGVPGSPADQTITVTGAVVGDRVEVAAPVAIPAGFLLQGFVSANDTVSVRWTQVSGAAADPDGGGGVYRVDVWKS